MLATLPVRRYSVSIMAGEEKQQHPDYRYLQAIGELLPAGLFGKDAEGRYVYANSTFASYLGLQDSQQWLHKTPAQVLSPERAQQAAIEDRAVLEEGKLIANQENFDKRTGRGDRWTLVSKAPVRDDEGKIIGLVGMALDIHDRKLAEERLRHMAAELEMKNRKLEADLALAREIQNAMLPKTFAHDQPTRVDVAHVLQLSSKLGGDFIKVAHPRPGLHLIFICDVMGHGIQAALIAFLLSGLIQNLVSQPIAAGEFLTELNRRFCQITHHSAEFIFATALCLTFDEDTQRCSYASAGHPLPLVRTPGDPNFLTPSYSAEQGRCAIGVVDDADYATDSFDFPHRSTLALFTDGIIEHATKDSDELGREGLAETLREHQALSAQHIVQKVIDRIQPGQPTEEEDDLTLFVLKNA